MKYSNVPLISNLFQHTDNFPFADLHFWNDPDSQLQAIIAIHNTSAGPALGGCRMFPYASTEDALFDVLHLAQGMSYKAAINRLPFGGGKSVIMHPGIIRDRQTLMASFGRFVNSLGGRYITAVDVGTSTSDMDCISHFTPFVSCTSKPFSSKPFTSKQCQGSGDPSPFTARGVLRGIQAVTTFLFNTRQLQDIHVAIQGLGHVGYALAKLLYNAGARLTVSDIDPAAVKRCVNEFSARAVAPEAIYGVECDIFAPCAMGQIINPKTCQSLTARAVAGAANNQLLDNQQGEVLQQKNILYAPDFVINSAGLIQIAFPEEKQLNKKIDALYDTLLTIFHKAQKQGKATNIVANELAEQILAETQRATCKTDVEQIKKIQA